MKIVENNLKLVMVLLISCLFRAIVCFRAISGKMIFVNSMNCRLYCVCPDKVLRCLVYHTSWCSTYRLIILFAHIIKTKISYDQSECRLVIQLNSNDWIPYWDDNHEPCITINIRVDMHCAYNMIVFFVEKSKVKQPSRSHQFLDTVHHG